MIKTHRKNLPSGGFRIKATRLRLAAMAAAALMSATIGGLASPPHAAALPPNCEMRPWGFMGIKTRQICDGPIQADGTWLRRRMIGIPAHYAPASSSCSGGSYSSYCTYYPGGYVGDQLSDDETYPVRPDTVLPDEPGHLG
ncbi:CDGP domain-containing protein [Mycobacterium mantenii]|uniref:CDGP domain-containing protein n=1 Tax=Mycobacterium mantenii TaxID=560555 RepID=UPI000B13A947|nr:hypothetical protein [Mycobacterium mantenii]